MAWLDLTVRPFWRTPLPTSPAFKRMARGARAWRSRIRRNDCVPPSEFTFRCICTSTSSRAIQILLIWNWTARERVTREKRTYEIHLWNIVRVISIKRRTFKFLFRIFAIFLFRFAQGFQLWNTFCIACIFASLILCERKDFQYSCLRWARRISGVRRKNKYIHNFKTWNINPKKETRNERENSLDLKKNEDMNYSLLSESSANHNFKYPLNSRKPRPNRLSSRVKSVRKKISSTLPSIIFAILPPRMRAVLVQREL